MYTFLAPLQVSSNPRSHSAENMKMRMHDRVSQGLVPTNTDASGSSPPVPSTSLKDDGSREGSHITQATFLLSTWVPSKLESSRMLTGF